MKRVVPHAAPSQHLGCTLARGLARRRGWGLSLGLIGAGALVLAACGGGAPSAGPATGQQATQAAAPQPPESTAGPTQVKFLLDGPGNTSGVDAPDYAAGELGYFKAEGLQVTVVPGNGALTTAQLVGNGQYDFGQADASSVAAAITKGVPIKVVAVLFQKSPLSVLYPLDHPITKPSDLIGKRIAASPGSTSAKLFPAFLAANHIDPSKVTVVGASSITASVTAITEGKLDGALNFNNFAIPLMAAHGVKLGALLWADHGMALMSESVIVNDDYLKAHPDVVRGFVTGLLRGWTYATQHVQQAVQLQEKAVGKQLPAGVSQLQLTVPLTTSAYTQGHPLGWSSEQAWSAMLKTLSEYQGLGKPLPPSAYFTNAYIPQS